MINNKVKGSIIAGYREMSAEEIAYAKSHQNLTIISKLKDELWDISNESDETTIRIEELNKTTTHQDPTPENQNQQTQLLKELQQFRWRANSELALITILVQENNYLAKENTQLKRNIEQKDALTSLLLNKISDLKSQQHDNEKLLQHIMAKQTVLLNTNCMHQNHQEKFHHPEQHSEDTIRQEPMGDVFNYLAL